MYHSMYVVEMLFQQTSNTFNCVVFLQSSFKLNISDVRVTPDSEMDTSNMPPPPYSPPLPMMSQSSSHQQ